MARPITLADSGPLRTAVIYLRVSTKEQAERGGRAEGFSIPAQRQALERKAESLGAVIVAEFVDAGESARSADRPDLQRMLTYLQSNQVDYVLVHKLDRLARNRVDDVEITLAIRGAGSTLVSATENIDESPSGALMHGIMSSIAEFYSRNLAQEVTKGLTQKVASGGTVSRAPIGYRNVRKYIDGREIRTVEIDDERADLIRWAFATYATGEWSLRRLADALEARDLTYRRTAKQVERPIRANKLHHILRNRYYIGYVTWQGVEHQGAHPAIIDQATFDRVQAVLDSHALEGVRQRRHLHYLNGTVHCGRCGSRLLYTLVKGNGGQYEYFVCSGRHTSRNDCDLPYLPLDKVEQAVITVWRGEQASWLTEGLPQIEHGLVDQLRAVQAEATHERSLHDQQIHKIKRDRLKWAEKAMEGVVPADIARDKQQQLARQLAALEERSRQITTSSASQEEILRGTIALITDCASAYLSGGLQLRRTYNQAWFSKITLDAEHDDLAAEAEHTELIGALHRSTSALSQTEGVGLVAASTPSRHTESGESLSSRLIPYADGSIKNPLVVLWRQLSNATSQVKRAVAAYRQLDLPEACPTPEPRPARRTVHRLTASEIDEAAEAYRAGATLREIGAQLGVDRKTVGRNLRAHGIQLRRKAISPEEIQHAAELYEQGLSIARIAEKFGYHGTTIHLRLKAVGVVMRDTHGRAAN